MRAQSPNLAHIDQTPFDAAGAQQIHDPISDVALRDTVQRQAHAGPGENDPVAIEDEVLVAHTAESVIDSGL